MTRKYGMKRGVETLHLGSKINPPKPATKAKTKRTSNLAAKRRLARKKAKSAKRKNRK